MDIRIFTAKKQPLVTNYRSDFRYVVEDLHNVKPIYRLLCTCCRRDKTEERFSLTDQIRRSSRSVAANISEAWRKRRYPAAFVSKLSDAETEAAETQTWIEISLRCGYLAREEALELDKRYEEILSQLVAMASHPEKWTIHSNSIPARSD